MLHFFVGYIFTEFVYIPVTFREREAVEGPQNVWGRVSGGRALQRDGGAGLEGLVDELVEELGGRI